MTGWAMDIRIRDTLVLTELNQAIGREHPKGRLLVHTDRGANIPRSDFNLNRCALGFGRA